MNQMKSLSLQCALVLLLLFINSLDSAAVGKGVGAGGRGVKGTATDKIICIRIQINDILNAA